MGHYFFKTWVQSWICLNRVLLCHVVELAIDLLVERWLVVQVGSEGLWSLNLIWVRWRISGLRDAHHLRHKRLAWTSLSRCCLLGLGRINGTVWAWRSLGAFQDFFLLVTFEIATWILLGQSVRLFCRLGVSTRFSWLYKSWLIFVTRKILFGHTALNATNVDATFGTVDLIGFVARGLNLASKFVAWHWVLGRCYYWLSAGFTSVSEVLNCSGGVSRCHFAYRVILLFWSCLLLTFFAISTSWFLLSWDRGLLSCSLNGLLHCWWVIRTTLLRVGIRAANFIVETKDVPHALLYLRLAETWHVY
jgi:hypothetical protein